MSTEGSPVPRAQADTQMTATTTNQSQKSYRRKYRKIMVKFERQMRDSNKLFKDEQRMQDISQRIAEQNDQMLNLLLELNDHPQIPSRVRYDLGEATTPKQHSDPQETLEKLRVMRHSVQKGEVRQSEYQDFELDVLDTIEFVPQRTYRDLVKRMRLRSNSDEYADTGTGGFLSGKQEEDYKASLDHFMTNPSANPRSHAAAGLGQGVAEREREAQLRNPVSVYNWLRKNQPQVFLQDADNDKPKAAPRASKRASTSKLAKADPEMYDEDGIALETSTSRSKRKREDDHGYRPKGGHARPIKRRKEESGRRSKRTSMDISAS